GSAPLVIFGGTGIDPATAAGDNEGQTLKDAVLGVVVGGVDDGVVAAGGSRCACFDGAPHAIVEGSGRDGVVLVGDGVNFVTGQGAGSGAIRVGAALGGVAATIQGKLCLDGVIPVAV